MGSTGRPYEYEEKDEWGRSTEDRVMDVDHYIASLDDPKEAFTASVTQRLAITTSLLVAIANVLDEVIPRLRDSEYSIEMDGMFVTMLGDVNVETRKTEELMGIWETVYGQEN